MEPSKQREPIALVGMACRLPGEASSPSRLWQMLLDRRSGHCRIPESRFRAEAFHHPDADRPGSINSSAGYFLSEDIHAFENAFFGINNKEASYMDAQQRKLLEVAYESLESAGVPFEAAVGSNTGVFVANFTLDYMIMQYKDPEYFSRYSAIGSGATILANRITHCFDLKGPSSVVDTACSSSLYSLHAACSALDAHECDAALVASANLIQSPEQQLIAVKAGILSPEGICHTFDAAANGYGRAEAVSSLYLKRLSDAIRDGDPVRCVIRGTAVNGNGKTPGITQPSIQGQAAVIRKAYHRAGLPLDKTDYVEAHGTGTKVGDPIEVEAISSVLQHADGRPILIGGIKPNLGHSEGASGISSIIKVALALESGTIPATIGIRDVNANIRMDEWNVSIASELRVWPASDVPRASINSFGFGGSNGHVILEAAEPHLRQTRQASAAINGQEKPLRRQLLFPVAARSSHSLARAADNLRDYIARKHGDLNVRDLCHTLANRRSMLSTRGYLLSNAGTPSLEGSSLITLESTSTSLDPFAFVYTGQGAQWPQMGLQLLNDFPTFRQTLQQLDACLASLGTVAPRWTFESIIMSAETSKMHEANISQPLCTALQIALTDLLSNWNLRPAVVLGHSSGEIAAAYATGALSKRRAIVTAYLRGYMVAESSKQGAMLAVGLDQQSARQKIAELHCEQKISVACVNSAENVTLSGDKQAVDQLYDLLHAEGTFARRLKTDEKAYHSHHMKAIGAAYQQMLETYWQCDEEGHNASHETEELTVISTVTGERIDLKHFNDSRYWRTNLESTVQFEGATTALLESGRYRIVEIGPHGALELPIKQTASRVFSAQDGFSYHPTLVRHKDSTTAMLTLAGNLFLHGYDICLDGVNCISKLSRSTPTTRPQVLHDLPTYPWDYKAGSLWNEPRNVTEFRNRRYPRHDLLGSQVHHGNPSRTSWRNMLSPEEVTWLQDHRLGPTMVFPAAAYLAMAVEAICQVSHLSVTTCPGVEIHAFFLLKAMDFSNEESRVEIFTEMTPESLTTTSSSASWWRFRVHSVVDSQSTEHANGLVRLAESPAHLERKLKFSASDLEQQAIRTWYGKFTSEGLTWGPKFAVMEDVYCDRDRKLHISSARTKNVIETSEAAGESQYMVHPINLDGMLQTAFVATTGGVVRNLRATVPVSIGRVNIVPRQDGLTTASPSYIVDSQSRTVGFGTVNIDAELRDTSDNLLVTFGDVRCVAYAGNAQSHLKEDRNPLVRVVWKPDIRTLRPDSHAGLTRYLEWFSRGNKESPSTSKRATSLAATLDLITHWRPDLRILEFGGIDEHFTTMALKVLLAGSPLRRMKNYIKATVTAENQLVGHELSENVTGSSAEDVPLSNDTFDLVILPSVDESVQSLPSVIAQRLDASTIYVKDGSPLASIPGDWLHARVSEGSQVSLLVPSERSSQSKEKTSLPILLVHSGELAELDNALLHCLSSISTNPVQAIALSEVNEQNVPSKVMVVTTLEAKQAILRDLNEVQMTSLKVLTDTASKIVWLTNCNIMRGERPDFAPVQGLARAIMLEQPSTVFSVLDIDDTDSDHDVTADNVRRVLLDLLNGHNPDFEFAQVKGVMHSLRWIPDEHMNSEFRARQNAEPKEMPIREVGSCKLSLTHPGQLDTLHFVSDPSHDLDSDFVEIRTQCVSINAKDLYALGARVDTKDSTCSCECTGIVSRVGSRVDRFKPGDRVVAMAPGHFATVERLPQWACYKLLDEEDFASSAAIPLVYSTAIYAFSHRAKLEAGETVLIHSAAGGVGIAAIQLARNIGAEIFATVGSEAKRDFLVQHFGLDSRNIFNSRDNSFLPKLMAATHGRGVDVVLNSLTGELLHSSLAACADFGRFVEIGKRDILDHGRLDMAIFQRNISFMAFDLSNLYYSSQTRHHDVWQNLVAQSMQLFRTCRCKHVFPPKVFDASQVTEAFRHFSSQSRTGKVVVSFQNPQSLLKVVPQRYDTRIGPDKAYFMVGCLGGLGRSISRWMASRGAKNFIFLGRSGTDKPQARALVEDLERSGCKVAVVRGDVSSLDDVRTALAGASVPIGGVIQAAMGLNEALWTSMSCKSWHTAIDPKVRGTWNIHNTLLELQKDDVDFFVLTSSISGTVGTATESNYCSGNAFLDSFARYRNGLGLQAISIGLGMISEVGYLHEHPDIEKLLKRKGIHAINEDELLQILDLALAARQTAERSQYYDSLVTSHVLTGIEFVGLKEQRDRGFEGDNHVLADPRASLLAEAFTRSTGAAGGAHSPTEQSLPEEIKKSLRSSGSDSVIDAVREIVATKISNLILLPREELNPDQYLSEFGIDSMLAAEFRTYIFHALEVDVPFMTLLGKTTTVSSLAQLVVDDLEQRVAEKS